MAAPNESNLRLSWGSPAISTFSCRVALLELDIMNLDEQNEAKRA
jgi:hypothetical protein